MFDLSLNNVLRIIVELVKSRGSEWAPDPFTLGGNENEIVIKVNRVTA